MSATRKIQRTQWRGNNVRFGRRKEKFSDYKRDLVHAATLDKIASGAQYTRNASER